MDPGRYSDVFNTSYGCTLNGAPTSCEVAMSCISSGGCAVEDIKPANASAGPSRNGHGNSGGGHGGNGSYARATNSASATGSSTAHGSSTGIRPRIVASSASATRPRIVSNGSAGEPATSPQAATRGRIVLPPVSVDVPAPDDEAITADHVSSYSPSFTPLGDDDYLWFDGCTLTYADRNGIAVNSWRGVSGKSNNEKPYDENVANLGPLPTGTYIIDPSKIQKRYDKWLVERTTPKQMENGVPSNIVEGGYRYPDWVETEPSGWGDFRVQVTPFNVTIPPGRDGGSFFLHGSNNGWGSAGCIDVGSGLNCQGVLKKLEERRTPILLYVKYDCNPWVQPWINKQ